MNKNKKNTAPSFWHQIYVNYKSTKFTQLDFKGYRPDIDGLRAIAVLPVVLYHLHLPLFSGGYVGVDVFFVISGYLIARLILGDMQLGTFSIAQFYERRARRILPALFVVIFVTSIFSTYLLMPTELFEYGKSVVSVVFFVSNFYFLSEVDYFDSPAIYKPLLHTWSLAVEEQFYIFFPVFLLIVLRYLRRDHLPIILSVCGAISLAFSIYVTDRIPEAAFYLLPTRAVELLIGAVLAAVPVANMSRAFAEALAAVGFLMIGYAILMFDAGTNFPGWAVLLPCLGAAALIQAGQTQNTFVTRILSLPPVVWVGLISYSLYLWHWPVFVLAQHYVLRELWPVEQAALFVLSFVLAALSWKYVEQPVRRRSFLTNRTRLAAGSVAAAAALGVVGAGIVASGGLPQRLPDDAAAVLQQASYNHPYRHCHSRDIKRLEKFDVCKIGAKSAHPSFLIWGDSHADMLVPAIARAAEKTGRSGVVFTRAGCAPKIRTHRVRQNDENCDRMERVVMAFIKQNPHITDILLAGFWHWQADGVKRDGTPDFWTDDESKTASAAETLQVFRRGLSRIVDAFPCRSIYLIADSPEPGFEPPKLLARLIYLGRQPDMSKFNMRWRDYVAAQAGANSVLRKLAERERVFFVPVDDVLCPKTAKNEFRLCPIIWDTRVAYRDSNHLSVMGAYLLVDRFTDLLSAKLADDAGTRKSVGADDRPACNGR